MAFDNRLKELREIVRTQYPGDEVGTVDEAVERGKEKAAVLDAIERFGNGRASRLERLANVVDLKGDAEKRWESEATLLRSDMHSTLADALRNVKTPTMLGLRIVTGATLEEDKLCDAVEKARPVAAAMDAIVTYNKELSEKIDALKAKWEESQRLAEAIMRDESTVIEELTAVMKQAVEAQASLAMNRRETVRAWIKASADAASLVGSALPIPQPVKDLLKNAKEAADLWEKLAADLPARKARYEAYFQRDHTSLLVMFSGTRQDAQDFLDKHDYTRMALDWTSKARAALADVRSACQTAGQTADIEECNKIALSRIDEAEKAAKERWDRFVSENKEKFFGAFTPELDKALLGSEKWNEAYRRIAAVNLQGLLSRWIDDDARDWREIEQAQMPDAWREEFRNAVKESLHKLAKTEEEIVRNTSPDMLMVWISGMPGELRNKVR